MIEPEIAVAGLPLAAALVFIVQFFREETESRITWTPGRLVVLVFLVGEALCLGLWAAGFLPAETGWRDAALLGAEVAVAGAGGRSLIKPLIADQTIRSLVHAEPAEAQARVKRATRRERAP